MAPKPDASEHHGDAGERRADDKSQDVAEAQARRWRRPGQFWQFDRLQLDEQFQLEGVQAREQRVGRPIETARLRVWRVVGVAGDVEAMTVGRRRREKTRHGTLIENGGDASVARLTTLWGIGAVPRGPERNREAGHGLG